jgi:hypothetical protein
MPVVKGDTTMKVKYLGPQGVVRVGGFGQHKQNEVKDYPAKFAEELIRTSKKQHFEIVDPIIQEKTHAKKK